VKHKLILILISLSIIFLNLVYSQILFFENSRIEFSNFSINDDFTADYWIAKGFILLSDIYIDQDNIFQAKATLESIIENHDGKDLVNIARKKWESILESEKEIDANQLNEESFIEISEDDFQYEVKEIDENYIVPIPDTLSISKDSIEILNKNILEDEL